MADRTVVIQLRAAVGQFNAQMASAAATTRGMQASAAQMSTGVAGATRRAGQSVGGLSRQVGLLNPKLIGGAGLVFGLKQAADAAIEWEAAFADVRKTVDGTPEQLAAIETGLRRMSGAIPTSAEDLAGIASSAGQLGIETDSVLEFTRVIADLGETTNLAGEQGATELARFANIIGMSQGDFDRLGSTIVDLGNNFATTEAEISQMAMRIAGAGAQIGLAESDILGIATALSSVGIEAQAGGTAISRVMIDIANEVSTGGDRLEGFADVAGMSAQQFSTAWEEDAAGALVAFISGLGSMEDRGGDALQTLEELELSEIRVRDALLRASGAGDLLSDAIGRGNEAWEENNALQEEAALRYETTSSKISMAGNELKELLRTLGSPVGSLFGVAAEGVGGAAAFANEFIRAMQDPANTPEMETELERLRTVTERRDFSGTGPADVTGPAGVRDTISTTLMFRTEGGASVQEHIDMLQRVPEAAAPAQRSIADMVGPYSDLAGAAEDALDAQQEHEDFLKRATDPVFNLHGALADLEGAQQDYNDAVEEFGANSPEAAAAAFEIIKRVRDLQLAVMDGDLSFAEFEAQLKDWERQGLISAEVADLARREVSKLTDASEEYAGNYVGEYFAKTKEAEEKIRGLLEQIRSIPGEVHVSFTADDNVVVRREGQGGGLVVGSGGSTSGGSTTSSSRTVSPGRMHRGGVVSGPAGWMAGMAADERLRLLQLGEVVVPRGGGSAGSQNTDNSDRRTIIIHGEPTPRTVFRSRDLAGL